MAEMIEIDVSVEAGNWPDEATLRGVAEAAVGATIAELEPTAGKPCELSLLFTDDAHVQSLNRDWRGKDKPTNVLSFPASDMQQGDPLPTMLGDIVMAKETISSEAALEGKPFEHHLTHLIVHGLLHLLGYDHEGDQQAKEMEALERCILARLAIPDPYG